MTEDRFTPPRPDCPNPRWWHSPDDESAELEVSELVGGFVRALQPVAVLETGSAYGHTSRFIGLALQRNRHGHLWTLENAPERAAEARKRTAGLPVHVIEADSLTWRQPEITFDFGWLDSLLDLRVKEFQRYRWSPGAIVGFHDTGPQHGYRPQVEALGLRQVYLRTPRGVTFVEAP